MPIKRIIKLFGSYSQRDGPVSKHVATKISSPNYMTNLLDNFVHSHPVIGELTAYKIPISANGNPTFFSFMPNSINLKDSTGSTNSKHIIPITQSKTAVKHRLFDNISE